MFEAWPFTNFHDLNLDWIIKTIKDWVEKMQEFVTTMTDAWDAMKQDWTDYQQGLNNEWQEFIDNTYKDQITEILEDHPEWVTTVMDGAITYNKLNSSLRICVTPEMFGAVGDGVTDDTDAINQAVQSDSHLVIFTKNYAVQTTEDGSVETGIEPTSDKTLLFLNSSVIGLPNLYTRYAVIHLEDVENVEVIGANIICDRLTETGEHGFGVVVRNCENIKLKDLTITNPLGDGIAIGNRRTSADPTYISKNVTVENVVIDHARRNGITITGVDGVTIDNCLIKNIVGTAPQAGIDVEPDFSPLPIDNIIIKNTVIEDTAGGAFEISNGTSNTPVIIDNMTSETVVRNGSHPVNISDSNIAYIVAGNSGTLHVEKSTIGKIYVDKTAVDTKITNCHITGPERSNFLAGVILRDTIITGDPNTANTIASSNDNTDDIIFENCRLEQFRAASFSGHPVYFRNCVLENKTATSIITAAGALKFENCEIVIENATARAIYSAKLDMIGCTVTTNYAAFIDLSNTTYAGMIANNMFYTTVDVTFRACNVFNNIYPSDSDVRGTGTHTGNLTY